ncbi:MAG TPA: DUF222 domain-containing protein, partial [Ilumatobacteraceae bacterium]|nr:DUF222 domain-containing protein [Ilumatobacteraceae bacterium]
MGSFDLPVVADLQGLGSRDLEVVLGELDIARRRVETLIAETVAVAERSRAYREDGHRSVFAWVRAVCNCSAGTARAVVQTAHLLRASSEVRQAAHEAGLGVDQLRELAAVHANPRARDLFADSAELLIADARRLWFDEFKIVARRWEDLADQDGALRSHRWADDHRDARVRTVGDQVYVDARGGVVAGAIIEEVFSRFCDAEFCADWERAVRDRGEQARVATLARTPAQRRFDALLAMCTAAAQSGRAGQLEPLVNVVVDLDTFEHHLGKACRVAVEALDPKSVDRRRCETIDGHQLDPTDVLTAALVGHVRRVVLDSSGV